LPIALQCLDALIGKRRRQVPASRVFAFVKRLSTLALQTDCNGSLALLALINSIVSVGVLLFNHLTTYVLFCNSCNVLCLLLANQILQDLYSKYTVLFESNLFSVCLIIGISIVNGVEFIVCFNITLLFDGPVRGNHSMVIMPI